METGNREMPCKIRKRRLPTGSFSSFGKNNLSQFLVEKSDDSPRNEKCSYKLDRSCKEKELVTKALRKQGDDRLNEVIEKSIGNVDRSRIRVSAHESNGPYGEMTTETKNDGHLKLKPVHGLDEIKHSLTVSKDLLKLLTHVWTANSNHDHHHPTTMSLASILNHELNKARSHVNKLIQEQRSNDSIITCESKEQDKIRVAVKTIARELETERKLRRQTERMNKKLGRELANTKSCLDKAIKKAESEKQATELIEQLCEKMAVSIEQDRAELEELKKESEKVREEMDQEREMLRVADIFREERVQMKLIDAKYEYEDKHKQMNVLVHDLEALLEADNGIDHLKRSPSVLSWYQSTIKNKGGDENATLEDTIRSLWHENKENEKTKVVIDENVLGENTGEVINNEMANTNNEVIGRNSDCIEWEFGFDMKNGSEDLNECLEERVSGLSCSSTMKEYEDEMERYKMIKDLRDRIVSGGSDLSRDTIEFGSYMYVAE